MTFQRRVRRWIREHIRYRDRWTAHKLMSGWVEARGILGEDIEKIWMTPETYMQLTKDIDLIETLHIEEGKVFWLGAMMVVSSVIPLPGRVIFQSANGYTMSEKFKEWGE